MYKKIAGIRNYDDEDEINGEVEDDDTATEGAGDTSGDNEDIGTEDVNIEATEE